MKWYGQIGYWTSVKDESDPFKTIHKITEKNYYGDLLRNTKRDQSGSTINDNFTISNQITILADPFAFENFHHMRYVTFFGNKWKITSATVQFPRITLEIGQLYSEEEENDDEG